MSYPSNSALFSFVLLIAFFVGVDQSAAQQPNQQLQQLLNFYPDADANKDGILTPEEARDRFPKS